MGHRLCRIARPGTILIMVFLVPVLVFLIPLILAAGVFGIMLAVLVTELQLLVTGNARDVGHTLIALAVCTVGAAATTLVPLSYDWYFRRLPADATALGLSAATVRILSWLVFVLSAASSGIGLLDVLR
jgi:hypothetical protein